MWIIRAVEPPENASREPIYVERATDIECRIRATDERHAHAPHRLYGLSLRVCGAVLNGAIPEDDLVAHGHHSAGTGPRPLLLRPAPEPIVHSYWGTLTRPQQSTADICQLASCLYTTGRELRKSPASSTGIPDEPITQFADADSIERLLQQRRERRRAAGVSTLQWAFLRFLDFNSIHPFSDGNGRTARALLMLDIGGGLGLCAPCLPFDPVVYLNSYGFTHYYRRLHVANEWQPFFGFFLDIVERTIGAAESQSNQ